MIEESYLFRSVVWNITISSLRVIRVTRVIPAYRWAGAGVRRGVGLRSLYPALRYVVVAQLPDDGVVADVRVLRVTVRTLHRRHAGGDALLLIVCLFLLLYLIHTLRIVLLTSMILSYS